MQDRTLSNCSVLWFCCNKELGQFCTREIPITSQCQYTGGEIKNPQQKLIQQYNLHECLYFKTGQTQSPKDSFSAAHKSGFVCCTLHVKAKHYSYMCNARKTEHHSHRQEENTSTTCRVMLPAVLRTENTREGVTSASAVLSEKLCVENEMKPNLNPKPDYPHALVSARVTGVFSGGE